MNILVFESRKRADAERASTLLREAWIPHAWSRRVGGVEVEMTHDAEDMPALWWLLRVPQDRVEQARDVLAPLVQETKSQPRSSWPGMLYFVLLFAMIATMAVRSCG
ncbi:MAG: hypothetical protein M3Q69_02735 [Acidobacteriota bacterium]|nr:hypothetical protein [Acidobacteriota bacterium]